MSAAVWGMWVVRTSITSQESVERAVELAVERGFNALMVQVRGRGDAFYANGLEPPGKGLDDPDFDPLDALLKQASGTAERVHAWINAFFAWKGSQPPRSPRYAK